jgi:hypothetical protein
MGGSETFLLLNGTYCRGKNQHVEVAKIHFGHSFKKNELYNFDIKLKVFYNLS